jgi:hypothetical protein
MISVVDFSRCSDCPKREVDPEGGLFVEPSLRLRREQVEFAAFYRWYQSGDFKGVLGLRFLVALK